MRTIFAILLVAGTTLPAWSDSYIMGAGRWTCGQVLEAWQGKPIDKGQVAGWILGYWSFATSTRNDAFVDTVEKVGGRKIVELTLRECQKAGADVMLYKVTSGMITNTK